MDDTASMKFSLLCYLLDTCNEVYDRICSEVRALGLEKIADALEKEDCTPRPEQVQALRYTVAKYMSRQFCKVPLWSWYDQALEANVDDMYIDGICVYDEKHVNHYDDMFIQHEGRPLRIMVRGDAGSGKETLARKILTDWCRFTLTPHKLKGDMSHFEEFDFVLPIFARILKDEIYLEEVFENQLCLDPTYARMLTRVARGNPTRTLFLVVGSDMIRPNILCDVETMGANRVMFCRRHSAVSARLSKTSCYGTMDLYGFMPDDVVEYVYRLCKMKKEPTEKAVQIISTIKSSEDARYFSRIPAFLLLMCTLWLTEGNVGTSITTLYMEFLLYICGRYERLFLPRDSHAKKDQLFNKYAKSLLDIASIASKGLLLDELGVSFPYDYVKEKLSDTAFKLGFLYTNRGNFRNDCMVFIHRTMQEFFIALHIVYSKTAEGSKGMLSLASSAKKFHESKTILAFICGLSRRIPQKIKDIIEQEIAKWQQEDKRAYKCHTDFLLLLLQETGSSFSLPSVIHLDTNEFKWPVLERFFSLSGEAVQTVIFENLSQMKHLQCLELLDASNIETLHLEGGTSFSQNSETAPWTLDYESARQIMIKLKPNNVTITGISCDKTLLSLLRATPLNMRAKQFTLKQCFLGLLETNALQQVITRLILECISITDCIKVELPQTNELVSSLGTQEFLWELRLSSNTLGVSGITELCSVLPKLKYLHVLELRAAECFEEAFWIKLMKSLAHVPRLQELDLSQNVIDNACAGGILMRVPMCPSLSCLKLMDNYLDDEFCFSDYEEDIRGSLSSLYLCNNRFTESFIKDLRNYCTKFYRLSVFI